MRFGAEFQPKKLETVPEYKMKVGFISTVQGHQWPGSEYLWSACAERLLKMQHQVVVSASVDLRGAKPIEILRSKGASVHLIPPVSGHVSRIRQRFFNPFRNLSKKSLDLLIISSGSAYDPVYQPALGQFLRETSIPFVIICHFNAETFWVDDPMREMMTAIFQKARTTVFVSRENLRLTERQLGMTIPRAEIIVPPLCLTLSEPLPWPDKADDEPWRFACVARLEPRWKGQDVLFEVLADEKWKGRNYTLSLFGQGAEESYLRKLSKFYDLQKKIIFAGFSNPMAIWRDHHLQILAARGEGGPMVITEGMICGRAAVTTRCGFNTDYIADGQTGFLAAFSTAECFGVKMEEAWSRREDWKEMGTRAHKSISKRAADFNGSERLLKLILCNDN
jgi:glycosyltransferase involved in cell wall biosynthesis